MSKSIYLIAPKYDYATYNTGEVFEIIGLKHKHLLADLSLTTVAGFVPEDFETRLCDEHATPVNYDKKVDFVGITGKSGQWNGMKNIAAEFKKLGSVIIMGGSFATLYSDIVRPYCDILVKGELENIAETFFSDLREGSYKDEYGDVGDRPSLDKTPVPRWDLYPNNDVLYGAVQTTKGCPNKCEFCELTIYAGNKMRFKPTETIMKELDLLYKLGYRDIFICDDNFAVNKARTKKLLQTIKEWNFSKKHGKVRFLGQLAMNVVDDEELSKLMSEAGLKRAFVGVETPNIESLIINNKKHNFEHNMSSQIQKFYDHGIVVQAGTILGFDGDGPEIFQQQYDFLSKTSVVVCDVNLLYAFRNAPLYTRLKSEGRIDDFVIPEVSDNTVTNIIPKKMTMDKLDEGYRWLNNALYNPDDFLDRLYHLFEKLNVEYMKDEYGVNSDSNTLKSFEKDIPMALFKDSKLKIIEKILTKIDRPFPAFIHSFTNGIKDLILVLQLIRKSRLGFKNRNLWKMLLTPKFNHPEFKYLLVESLLSYIQIRHMLESKKIWRSKHQPVIS